MPRPAEPPPPAHAGAASAAAGAGLPRRLAAFALDWLVLSVYIGLLAGVTLLLRSRFRSLDTAFADPVRANLLAFLTLIAPAMLYFAVLESGPAQATWGKRVVGLEVRTVAGERLRRRQALLRAGAKLLPWELAHTCLFAIPGWPLAPAAPTRWVVAGFGLVWVLVGADFVTLAVSRSHRAPYDWLAGSVVVAATPGPRTTGAGVASA